MQKTKKGFTLIELVVVMAIIAVLASLMVAAIMAARKQATNTQRVGNLKTIETALETRSSKCGGKYMAASTSPACAVMTPIATVSDISTALTTAAGGNTLTSSVVGSDDNAFYTVTTSTANNTYTIIAYDKDVSAGTTGATALYTAQR